MSRIQREKLGLSTTLLLTLFLSININLPEPWRDESSTLSAVSRPWNELLALVKNVDFVHAFYYVLAKLLTFGNVGIFQLRMISLMFIAVTIFTTFKVTELLTNKKTAALASLIFAIYPSTIFYSSEARSYAVVLGLFMVAMYFFVQYYFNGSQNPIGFWVFLLLSTYLQLMVFLFLPVVLVVHLLMKKHIKSLVFAFLTYIVLISPILIIGFSQRDQVSWLTKTSLKDPISFAIEFSYLNSYYFENTFSITSVLLISLMGLVFAPVFLVKNRFSSQANQRIIVYFLMSWFLIPSYTLYTISTQFPFYYPRFVIYCIPALAILSAVALTHLTSRKSLFLITIFFIALLGCINLQELRYSSAKSDWNLPNEILSLAAYKTNKIWFIENPTFAHEERAMFNAYPEMNRSFVDISQEKDSNRINLFSTSKPLSALNSSDFDSRGFISIMYDCNNEFTSPAYSVFTSLNLAGTDLVSQISCWKIVQWK